MNRDTRKLRMPPWMVLAIAATLAGCSSAPQQEPGGFGNQNGTGGQTNTNTGNPSGGSQQGQTQTQGNTGTPNGDTQNTGMPQTSSGSSTNTGTPTSSSGSSTAPVGTTMGSSGSGMMAASGSSTATSGSSSASGSTASSSGTAGFVGMPGLTDLAPPDPSDGIQFVTPPMQYTVQPNQEIFPNYCVVIPNDIQVGGFVSLMTEGSSHHFILYQGSASASNTTGPCAAALGNWVYATSTPGEVVGLNFPANVGLPMKQYTQLVINEHFINTGTAPSHPQIKLNVMFAKNVQYEAGPMVSFNTGIDVPPGTAAAPGKQTVSGTCTPAAGSKFFAISTHTHKHAVAAIISYIHNGQSTEVVHTGALAAGESYPADQATGTGVDWEHPGVGEWQAPDFLTTTAGDTFKYSCSYENTGSTAVTVGETAAYNEMCMAVGYYFPSSGLVPCN